MIRLSPGESGGSCGWSHTPTARCELVSDREPRPRRLGTGKVGSSFDNCYLPARIHVADPAIAIRDEEVVTGLDAYLSDRRQHV